MPAAIVIILGVAVWYAWSHKDAPFQNPGLVEWDGNWWYCPRRDEWIHVEDEPSPRR